MSVPRNFGGKKQTAMMDSKDIRGKGKGKRSLKSVSAKAVALNGISSSWLHLHTEILNSFLVQTIYLHYLTAPRGARGVNRTFKINKK